MSSTDADLVFKALADNKRREMLDLLKAQPLSTGDLCAHFGQIDRCTVMQHLSVLEKAGLIAVQRQGRVRMNYLDAQPIRALYERWISGFSSSAFDVLAKLQG